MPLALLHDKITELAGAADGLTVSGGEPFDQPGPLAKILRHWRGISRRSTLVFTGREFDEVTPWLQEHPGLIDAVISGPFDPQLPQTVALRGSDNQKLHVLSDVGLEFFSFERPRDASDRKLDVMFDDQGHAWFAGIPERGDLARLRRTLTGSGHEAITSDMIGLAAR
jgi:anaerobic ribonucleoside-triphosphate reductase activating protein